MIINIKKLPKSEIEIEGELDADIFESYFNKALKKMGENVELDGFRKGKVPESVLVSHIPEIKILEEMAEMAISERYQKIIESEKIDAIGRPEINITKLARKNPLGFKIKTAIIPETKLPDYQKVAQKILAEIKAEEKDISVSDEEVEKTIMDIRKSRAPKKHITDVSKEEHVHSENCDHDHETQTSDIKNSPMSDVKEEELPAFNDEFVKALGPFENMEDFKKKLKENIKLEKENQLKEKTRLKIVEKIIEGSEIDIPEILVEIELDKILYKMESDIVQMGLKFEDYLKHLNKTKEDLRKEFRNDGEKKAKLALVLNKISEVEKIIADEKEVEKEVENILTHYKDADPARAKVYAQNVLTNEKVFTFLEKQ
ncbi:MAG: trigger factor [Patescibacteria group bacterium]